MHGQRVMANVTCQLGFVVVWVNARLDAPGKVSVRLTQPLK